MWRNLFNYHIDADCYINIICERKTVYNEI